MTAPRNTSAAGPLENLLVAMEPNGIEAQEARGQRDLLESSAVPTEMLRSGREDYEELGFVFGDVVAGDPLFVEVTLPAGWKREGSDHAMWSYICDETGRKRVACFYKAAFYDRKAHMSLDQVPQDEVTR